MDGRAKVGAVTPSSLRRTSLYGEHVARHARLVPFAGWEMPMQYTGIVDEHQAVRTAAGGVREVSVPERPRAANGVVIGLSSAPMRKGGPK
jgi:hypothetical protein